MTTFLTREAARVVRASINAKAKEAGSKAMFRAPVKGDNGLWTLPGLTHGKTLSLKK